MPRPARAATGAGLRAHILRVCNWMAGGLAVTGAVAYTAADSGLCLSLPSTPPIWVIMLAPLGFVLVPSFGIQRMSAGTAAALFRIYAA